MAQMQWVVITRLGKRKYVGMYHGDQSGNVLIHCNDDILTIDFNILESKTYHFFLDDELYELEIEKVSAGFLYGLSQDKETHTPLNEARKKQEKMEADYVIYGLIAFVLIIVLITLVVT